MKLPKCCYILSNWLGGNYPGWQLAGWNFFQGGNSLGGNYPGGKFPGGNFPGGSYPGWELSGCKLSWVEFFFGGGFPGGSFHVTIASFPESKLGFQLVESAQIWSLVSNLSLQLKFEAFFVESKPRLQLVIPIQNFKASFPKSKLFIWHRSYFLELKLWF